MFKILWTAFQKLENLTGLPMVKETKMAAQVLHYSNIVLILHVFGYEILLAT